MTQEPITEQISRAYRYRLFLTPGQEAAVARQENQLRMVWNRLVNSVRRTLRDWEHGRRASLLAEFKELVVEKRATGLAMVKARKVAEEKGITVEQALRHNRMVAADGKLKCGPRRLGVDIAIERVIRQRDHFYGGQNCLFWGLIQKFDLSCENWLKLKGTAQAPLYKRNQDNVALQQQITKSTTCRVGPESDLSTMIGQAGRNCETVWHRALPPTAVIKQLAIAGRPDRRYLIVFFTALRSDLLKPFPTTGEIAGIDTGYCCALTAVNVAADQRTPQEYQPKLARDRKFLKRLRRAQRRMDRQKRAANPDCFNEDKTWKKGKSAKNVTGNMVQTQQTIQGMHEHLADARKDFYHTTAYQLLKKYDKLKIGAWRPPQEGVGPKPAAPGQARARRNRNRKGMDHAISMFEGIVKDKASLSVTPKEIEIIEEPYTTQQCAGCKQITGPKGPTNIVEWTCSSCGQINRRKGNAAVNIKAKQPA